MRQNMESAEAWIKRLPKIELHCHLDGSIPEAALRRLCRRHGIQVPEEEEEFLRLVQVSGDCESLREYLRAFELPLRCLQREEDFFEAARAAVNTAAEENTRHLELRFAPLLSETKQLSAEMAVEAVLAGMKEAEKENSISTGLILCAMRHFPERENLRTLELAVKYRNQGVCALDLAGDESAYPNAQFESFFRRVRQAGQTFILHAGECGCAENVRLAAEWGAARIGHGIAMQGDRKLQEQAAKRQVGIELCPKSNVQTKAVSSIQSYPLREFAGNGVKLSINTDNRTVTDTCLSEELRLLHTYCGLTENEAKEIMRQSADMSFAEASVKAAVRKELL